MSLLSTVPYLQRLSLEQNNIQSLPQLDVLAPLQQLSHIQLGTGNSVMCAPSSLQVAMIFWGFC